MCQMAAARIIGCGMSLANLRRFWGARSAGQEAHQAALLAALVIRNARRRAASRSDGLSTFKGFSGRPQASWSAIEHEHREPQLLPAFRPNLEEILSPEAS